MKTFFLFLLSIFSFCFVGIESKKCSENKNEEVDTCMQKMFLIGDRSQKFRETLDEMHAYCNNISDLQLCVKRYARECLPRFARQVTNMLLFGVAKVNKPLCANDPNKIGFTKIAKCGNINIEDKHACMDQFIDDLKDTELDGGDKKIPLLCCNFWKFKHCVRSTFDTIDVKLCPSKSVDGIINLIGGYAGDAMDLICGDYDETSDKCDKLFKSPAVAGKKSRKLKSKSKSLLPSFINIFTSL